MAPPTARPPSTPSAAAPPGPMPSRACAAGMAANARPPAISAVVRNLFIDQPLQRTPRRIQRSVRRSSAETAPLMGHFFGRVAGTDYAGLTEGASQAADPERQRPPHGAGRRGLSPNRLELSA